MPNVLALFPDTNVFIQCVPLDQVDWSEWKDFDEVRLIICRAIQSEIDGRKNKGSDRRSKRARAASSLIRELIVGGSGYKTIRDSAPCVRLYVRSDLKPSPQLADTLDYAEPDDQLVGAAHAYAQHAPSEDVCILTDDTGPMASAQMVGVQFLQVPERWLMPPEATETEKKISALQNELARLKALEPSFDIQCLDANGKSVGKLEFQATQYVPLNEAQVAALMRQLADRSPAATEFGSREPAERQPTNVPLRFAFMGYVKEVYVPATDDEIAEYRNEQYPKWLRDCEQMLRDLHKILEARDGSPTFCFSVTNTGTRPGTDVLITVQAKGGFTITASPDEVAQVSGLQLPRPPRPPRGKWQQKRFDSLLGTLAEMERMKGTLVPTSLHLPPTLGDLHRRDPDGFYWKPKRPRGPVPAFSLECQQWRHGIAAEEFGGQILFEKEEGVLSGALECHIHAANLSDVTTKLVAVRIEVTRRDVYDVAQELVQGL